MRTDGRTWAISEEEKEKGREKAQETPNARHVGESATPTVRAAPRGGWAGTKACRRAKISATVKNTAEALLLIETLGTTRTRVTFTAKPL